MQILFADHCFIYYYLPTREVFVNCLQSSLQCRTRTYIKSHAYAFFVELNGKPQIKILEAYFPTILHQIFERRLKVKLSNKEERFPQKSVLFLCMFYFFILAYIGQDLRNPILKKAHFKVPDLISLNLFNIEGLS